MTCRLLLIPAAGLAGLLVLTACGSSGSSGGSPTPSTADTPAPSSSPARSGNFAAGPAASGTIAQISGTTMQVQNQQSGQVAVSWASATKFTHTVTLSLAKVKAGDCVIAVAGSGTSSSATSFTAATLVVSSPVNGSCTGGVRAPGNGNGARPSGLPSGFPSGGRRPSGFPTGANRPSGAAGRGTAGAFASGKVTSVSGSTLVIAARGFGASNGTSTTRTVTAGSATKITTEAATTSGSLKVGKCVTAQGKADSSGTVAATSVRITDPVKGQCTSGFGGLGGFGGRNGG